MYKNNNKEEYNNIPVEYCRTCLGLAIKEDEGIVYCECGSTNIGTSSTAAWENLFYEEYGQPFLHMPNTTFKAMNDGSY